MHCRKKTQKDKILMHDDVSGLFWRCFRLPSLEPYHYLSVLSLEYKGYKIIERGSIQVFLALYVQI